MAITIVGVASGVGGISPRSWRRVAGRQVGCVEGNAVKQRFQDKLSQLGRYMGWQSHFRGNYDVVALAHYEAGLQSARFYTEHLLTAREFERHDDLLRHAVGLAKTDGLFLEFGVATGRTISVIANSHTGPVYGFDSFEGLPESWYGQYQRGAFARDDLPPVPANVTLVKGWFSDTLPRFLAEHPEPVSFAHIDSDLYSSAAFVLAQLGDRIRSGAVLLFDEYFNYPGWQLHEHKAFTEFVEGRQLQFRYDSFLRSSQPVCVVIAD
ncbi:MULTISPECIES: class I SAM-dependent methyltransferase [unclassified Mycobacterium]|uniref:class I SAM-dependent methyltransferase n=1 Tax=unclassified Mycobacterium TaxID=2642494 RepID=UPI0018D2BA34|nr:MULTISPECIES: class I SAM-dependent methyltransferase [unclassified Mycobacterium]